MEFYQVVGERHSRRDFLPKPVPRAGIERVLSAATAAPSAQNEQPWTFYVATGATRQELGEVIAQSTVHLSEFMEVLGPKRYEDAVHWYSSLGDAPVLIAITVPKPDDEFTAVNRYLSVGAALENLLLAATAEGLGACNITFSYWVGDEVVELLKVGPDSSIVTIVALGWPSDMPPAAPQKRDDVAVWLD